MQKFNLDTELSLLVEADNKKLRFIIAERSLELACRKETRGKLNRYLEGTQNQLFKGRLQLHKTNGQIAVMLKGRVIGLVPAELLASAVNNL